MCRSWILHLFKVARWDAVRRWNPDQVPAVVDGRYFLLYPVTDVHPQSTEIAPAVVFYPRTQDTHVEVRVRVRTLFDTNELLTQVSATSARVLPKTTGKNFLAPV